MAESIVQSGPGDQPSPFEQIRRLNDAGNEHWSSRDFARVLGYSDYRNFEQVIEKARLACFNSGQRVDDHFVDITEMIGEKLRREKVKGKDRANQTHLEVGRKVRQTIKELGGTMPEHLPVAQSIKKLESQKRKRIGEGEA